MPRGGGSVHLAEEKALGCPQVCSNRMRSKGQKLGPKTFRLDRRNGGFFYHGGRQILEKRLLVLSRDIQNSTGQIPAT